MFKTKGVIVFAGWGGGFGNRRCYVISVALDALQFRAMYSVPLRLRLVKCIEVDNVERFCMDSRLSLKLALPSCVPYRVSDLHELGECSFCLHPFLSNMKLIFTSGGGGCKPSFSLHPVPLRLFATPAS
jgi:hypothetical protein